MKKIIKIPIGVQWCCSECGREGDSWKTANKHARQTGHSPTAHAAYDIYARDEEQ